MIFVTGDTHGAYDFAKMPRFAAEHPQLTKNDYVIIAGDFGAVWSADTLEADLKPYAELPFTVLFVDGNHENFDILDAYPVGEWHGGKVHIIKPNIIHLMRGQVFELEGNTFFTFGGAASVDKAARVALGFEWWKRERPGFDELAEGLENLKRYGNKVDYIITHTCCERALMYPPLRTATTRMHSYPENQMLSYFDDIVEYKHWYFGHYHFDADITDKITALYNEFKRID